MTTKQSSVRKLTLTLTIESVAQLDEACRVSGYSRSEMVMGMIEAEAADRARVAARRLRRIATK